MERVMLSELEMESRADVIRFLKQLWRQEKTDCPICGTELELLHKKAKKNTCDWQCRACQKTYKTLHLLDELNDKMPN